ncbi:hypothetical protein ACROYT_G019309 [Oculina patagonica]
MRQILPSKSKLSGTEKLVVEEIELNDKLDIANSFNEYFTNVASTLLENRPTPCIQQPVPRSQTSSQIFSLPIINEWDMFKALSTMNHTKATGTDNIPAKALKIATPHINTVLAKIFNLSYSTGHFSSSFKGAKVTPIFKGGSVDSWKMAIDNTEKDVCAFLDLRKEFDTIDHNILLQKLSKHLHGKEYEWFRRYLHYLSKRSQYVSCNVIESEQQQITHGVP